MRKTQAPALHQPEMREVNSVEAKEIKVGITNYSFFPKHLHQHRKKTTDTPKEIDLDDKKTDTPKEIDLDDKKTDTPRKIDLDDPAIQAEIDALFKDLAPTQTPHSP